MSNTDFERLIALKQRAQERGGADYRAEDLTPVSAVATPEPIISSSIQECDCGNTLTVEDGDVCRQCRIANAWSTRRVMVNGRIVSVPFEGCVE